MELSKKKTLYIFLACIAVGLAVRLLFINSLSLTLDETQSIWQAALNVTGSNNLFHYIATDVHPPLFNLMLHFWMLWLGKGVIATRIFPLIFGMASLPAIYLLGREIYSRKVAITATIISVFNPIWIWYSLNVKNYSFLIFMTIISCYFYFKLLHGKNSTRNMLLYIIVQIFGMYSHYFFAFVMVVQFIGVLLYKKLGIATRFIILNAIALLFFIPWLLYFFKYHSSATQPNLGPITLFNIILVFFENTFGYHSSTMDGLMIALWPVAILSIFFFIHLIKKVSIDTKIIIIGAVFPVLLAYIVSQTVIQIFLTRYLVFISVFICILFANVIGNIRKKELYRLTLVLLIVLFFAMSYNEMTDIQSTAVEDYRDAVAYTQSVSDKHDLVLVSAPFTVYPFQYYYTGQASYQTFPFWNEKDKISFKPTLAQVKQLIHNDKQKYTGIVLIESFDQSHTNQTVKWFKGYLPVEHSRDFGYNLQVYKFRLSGSG